jgi:hypothetical protein
MLTVRKAAIAAAVALIAAPASTPAQVSSAPSGVAPSAPTPAEASSAPIGVTQSAPTPAQASSAPIGVTPSAPTPAQASSASSGVAPRDSVVIRGRVISLQNETARSVDVGPGVELALQRAFYPFLQGEIAVGYSRNGTRELTRAPYPDPVTYNAYIPMSQKLYVVPVTVAIRAILPASDLEPYLLTGAGMFFTKLEDQPADPTRAKISESAAPFGFFFGVGANVTISRRLFASFEGRYLFANSVSFFHGDRWSLNAVTASVGAGYRF